MAVTSYDQALTRLLAHEGGYSNHPSDPGGPTKYGITIADYRKYVKPGATADDVKAMPLEDAKRIYRAKYWDAQRCDELPAGVDYAVFDYGVNSGIGRSGKVLRRVLKLPDTTSVVSDAVIAAARGVRPEALVADICDERLRFLKALKTWPVFGKGWGRRVAEVRAASLALARHAPVPSVPRAEAQGRGTVPAATGVQQGAVAAVVVAGAGAAQQAHVAGIGLAGVSAIAIGAIVLAVVGWFVLRRRRAQLQERAA